MFGFGLFGYGNALLSPSMKCEDENLHNMFGLISLVPPNVEFMQLFPSFSRAILFPNDEPKNPRRFYSLVEDGK